jgi:flagellar basal-body rod protein FlgB
MLNGISSRLEQYLDLLSARQRLTASNIANADTPGYKSKDIDFHFEFMSAVQGESARVIETPGLPAKNDGNNVSVDLEARMLAENAIRFSAASQLLRSQIRLVRSAIQEGRSG